MYALAVLAPIRSTFVRSSAFSAFASEALVFRFAAWEDALAVMTVLCDAFIIRLAFVALR